MIITDPLKEFYAPLLHERILVLVAMDVDALCASRILQTLFQIDHVRLFDDSRVGSVDDSRVGSVDNSRVGSGQNSLGQSTNCGLGQSTTRGSGQVRIA